MFTRRLARAALGIAAACLLAACAGPAVQKPDDNYRTYYEIFVGSFYDTNGDGLGDLNGVTDKLDYVADKVGADAIWLMPIMPSPSYHKYDVTDYESVDAGYGTLADFDSLIAAAHKRHLRVILDLVLNHTSNRHPWFDQAVQALWQNEASPYIEYYHFTKDDPGQGYNKITDQYYYECRFVSGMPDLNLDSQAVRDEIERIVNFWLAHGVDGFRLDAVTSYYTGEPAKNIAFLAWLNTTVKAVKPDAYLIGEAWTGSSEIADYYASGIDSFFNFPYSQATGRLVQAINRKDGYSFNVSLAAWNEQIHSMNAGAIDALFLSNHDQARSAGFLFRDPQKEKLAASLYLLAPGNPFIYYGEELGMTGSGADENKRLPMLWSTVDTTGIPYPPLNASQSVEGIAGADEQLKDDQSLLNFYHQVLAVKARYPGIARGTMAALDTGYPEIAAASFAYQDSVVTVFHNLASEARSIDLAGLGLAKARLTDSLVISAGDRVEKDGSVLTMTAYSTAFLK